MNKSDNTKYWQDCGVTGSFIHALKMCRYLSKTKYVYISTQQFHLGMYEDIVENLMYVCIETGMLLAALFIILKMRNNPTLVCWGCHNKVPLEP